MSCVWSSLSDGRSSCFLRKDYENLVIIDLICRGINTPKLLKGYMEILEERFQSKIIYFKVKTKNMVGVS